MGGVCSGDGVCGVWVWVCVGVRVLMSLQVLNEFVAYLDLREMVEHGTISERAEIIATYALCGFSNFASMGVQIGTRPQTIHACLSRSSTVTLLLYRRYWWYMPGTAAGSGTAGPQRVPNPFALCPRRALYLAAGHLTCLGPFYMQAAGGVTCVLSHRMHSRPPRLTQWPVRESSGGQKVFVITPLVTIIPITVLCSTQGQLHTSTRRVSLVGAPCWA
jgi:hypothetical protein